MGTLLRAVVCGVVSAGVPGLVLWFEVGRWDIPSLAVAPGVVALLLSRPRGWPTSYAWNAVAGVLGVAVGLATAAAIIDPSEHDSNLIFFTVVVFFFAGGLAFLGVMVAAPVAWGVSWVASMLSRSARE